MTRPDYQPLGDIVSDLNTIRTASDAYSAAGGLGPWLSNQVVAFRALPSSLSMLSNQVQRASAALTDSGAGATPAAQQVRDAGQLLDAISASYPATSQRVDRLTLALLPVLPKINAGVMDSSVISALLGSGLDIVQTVFSVNELLAKRDRAQQLVQDASVNPNLSPDQRNAVMAAMGGNVNGLVKVAAVLLIGYVIIRAVSK